MSRNTTSDVKKFSVYLLKKAGKLHLGTSGMCGDVVWFRDDEETGRIEYCVSTVVGDSYIELNYQTKERWSDGDWRSVTHRIPLTAVPCHFGGVRWFFRCPQCRNGKACGRRVAVLYQFGSYFGCRYCANLTYLSRNEGKRFRGFPWKTIVDADKADELLKMIHRKYYAGRPTRRFRRYLELSEGALPNFKEHRKTSKRDII